MRRPGVTTAYVRTKAAAGTNSPLVIILVRVKEAKTSSLLQNVRSMSSVRTKGLSAPQRFMLDSRVNSTVTVRRYLFHFKIIRTHLSPPSPDSCVGPDDFKELRDTTGRGLNVNGSICLNFACQYVFRVLSTLPTSYLFRFANVTAGSTCEIENTGYIAYGPSGEFVYVVSRYECDQSHPPIL